MVYSLNADARWVELSPLEFYWRLTKVPRRSIAYVLKTVWGNLAHREALKKETQCA
jgi:hypothetical protein